AWLRAWHVGGAPSATEGPRRCLARSLARSPRRPRATVETGRHSGAARLPAVPSRYLRPGSPTDDLRADFERIRAEFDVTVGFPDDVAAEAEERARAPVDTAGRVDLTGVPWVTIDPPGSMDLDQAMQLER